MVCFLGGIAQAVSRVGSQTDVHSESPRCLRNGARETREKTRKGMRGVGWEAHVTSRDPILDAVGTRSCAIRRGMFKKRATAIFDLPKKWGARNTRKDAKGDERCGLGGPCHIARPDIGCGRDALLRDPAWYVQKTCNGNI